MVLRFWARGPGINIWRSRHMQTLNFVVIRRDKWSRSARVWRGLSIRRLNMIILRRMCNWMLIC